MSWEKRVQKHGCTNTFRILSKTSLGTGVLDSWSQSKAIPYTAGPTAGCGWHTTARRGSRCQREGSAQTAGCREKCYEPHLPGVNRVRAAGSGSLASAARGVSVTPRKVLSFLAHSFLSLSCFCLVQEHNRPRKNDPKNIRTKENRLNLGLAPPNSYLQVSERGWRFIYKRNHINEIKNGTVHKIKKKKTKNPTNLQHSLVETASQRELSGKIRVLALRTSEEETELKSTSPHSLNKLNLLSLPLPTKGVEAKEKRGYQK